MKRAADLFLPDGRGGGLNGGLEVLTIVLEPCAPTGFVHLKKTLT